MKMRFGTAGGRLDISVSIVAGMLILTSVAIVVLSVIAPFSTPTRLCVKITRGKKMYLMNFVDKTLWGCAPLWPPGLTTFASCPSADQNPDECMATRSFASTDVLKGVLHQTCDYDPDTSRCTMSEYGKQFAMTTFSKRVHGVLQVN